MNEDKHLPLTYYVILAIALVLMMMIGGIVGIAIGVNPYLTATACAGIMLMREVLVLKKHGY